MKPAYLKRFLIIPLLGILFLSLSFIDTRASVPAINTVYTSPTLAGYVGGVATDSSGNIYVTLSSGSSVARIVKYNSAGVYVSQTGIYGTGSRQFKSPSGITVDASGNIYIADTGNHRIQKLNSAYTWQWTVGGMTAGTGNGEFDDPESIEVDEVNSLLYVTDSGNDRIQVFDLDGNYLSQFNSADLDPGPFGDLGGIAVDSFGNIYVADGNKKRI